MRSIDGMTPAQIREAAHDAIIRELGVSGLISYLHDQSLGSGDYTRDRHQWLPEYGDVDEMFADLQAQLAANRDKSS